MKISNENSGNDTKILRAKHFLRKAETNKTLLWNYRYFVSDKYWSNPQFFVTLRDADRLDGPDKCSLVVSLINKNNQTENKASENPDETIGFDILKVMFP